MDLQLNQPNSETSQPIEGPNFLRHAAFCGPAALTSPINIIGCGAVGSQLAFTMAKMGCHHFRLWDPDTVEAINLPNQAFWPKHIGQNKAQALAGLLNDFNPDIRIRVHPEYFDVEKPPADLEGLLVVAVDSMDTRTKLYNLANMNIFLDLVCEIRLGFDYGECFFVNPIDEKQLAIWRSTLYSSSETEESPCNLKICTTLVQSITAFAVHQICSFYATRTQDSPHSPPTRTVFSLNPQSPKLIVIQK